MNAALIGLGMVADTHIRALADAADLVSLSGICGRDPEKTRRFAKAAAVHLGHTPAIYPDADAIAADPNVDFVIICTPPDARSDLVALCAKAGKHILMEKPVARTFQEALAIVEMCESAKVTLGIVFQHRMRESARMLADLLNQDAFGPVGIVDIAVPWWRDQSYYDAPGRGTYERDGGGVLMSQAIHTLDLVLSLLGPVSKVQAMAKTTTLHDLEAEDFVTAGLCFDSGAVGSLVASTASFPGGPESITLHCEKASVVLASGQLDIQWRTGKREIKGEASGTGGGADPMAFTHAWHRAVLQNFAHAVMTGKPPIADGRTALDVHNLIAAIIQSSHEERAINISKDL
jgi:predicted dehydrogenase